MKHALEDLLALVLHWALEAWLNIGARGAWRGETALRGAALSSVADLRPLNRSARRALLRQAKRLNRQDLDRVA